jgi:tRNA dimethylallyltransferase
LHGELAKLDPEAAARLRTGDSQRVARAFEVVLGTRQPLSAWQRLPPRAPALPAPPRGYLLTPPRPALHARIEARLRAMIEAGALDEVEALLARRLDPALPVMKAVGVRALAAHLRGETTLGEALERTLAQTRQFAKRQLTWFRHRLPGLVRIDGFGDDPGAVPAVHTVRELVLTGL